MKIQSFLALSALFLVGCDQVPSERPSPFVDPIEVVTVTKIGQCTEDKSNWASSHPSRCAVMLSNGQVETLYAPVMVGQKITICPADTHYIKEHNKCRHYGI